QQVAGDLLTPGKEGLASAAFLTAGVHNTVVGGSEFMKKTARQDELEEIAGTVGQTFVGLTVNCARCHDHKFDPISQTEYYQFVSALSGVFHGEKEYQDPNVLAESERIATELASLTLQIEAIDKPVRERLLQQRRQSGIPPPLLPEPLVAWEFDANFIDRSGQYVGVAVGAPRIEDGALVIDDGKSYVETGPLAWDVGPKTLEVLVQLSDLDQRGGGVISLQSPDGVIFDAIVFGERASRRWMAGSNGFTRSQNFQGDEETDAVNRPVHIAIVYHEDGTIQRYRNGELYGETYKTGLQLFEANKAVMRFGIRHLPAGGNMHLRGRILHARLYDRALSHDEVAAVAGAENNYVRDSAIIVELNEEGAAQRRQLVSQREEAQHRLTAIEASLSDKVYSVVAQDQPGVSKLLLRGNAMDEAEPVSPGAVRAVRGVSAEFGLAPDASDAQRRKKLADWITHEDNPLFARVIVNRLWHHHFGSGIVETPNDFGFNGGRPSHPELLDWLASELRENGWSLKHMHRLIVQSATYRQASRPSEQAIVVDADNRFLWRKSPQRLDAESLRDAMLLVAGKLNSKRHGPGFRDVTVEYLDGTTYYTPIDEENEEFHRRTIYRFAPRGGRSTILDTFDCPDPATTAPRRTVTTTPLQALALLNNAFALRMSDHFGNRITDNTDGDLAAQVERAYRLAFGRLPNASEKQMAADLLRDHGSAALARVLFNSNEFITIE
ncbi:MAG: DUF1553 domain-containing protein, partial [Aeoliella sp.]